MWPQPGRILLTGILKVDSDPPQPCQEMRLLGESVSWEQALLPGIDCD